MSNFNLDPTAIWAALESHAQTLGIFERVNGHESRNAPGKGFSCDVMLIPPGITPVAAQSGLAAVSARVVAAARIYFTALHGPQNDIEPGLLNATGLLMGEYSAAFTLGGLVESVDLLGRHGIPLSAVPGWLNAADVDYRVMTITIPLIINDVWTEVA